MENSDVVVLLPGIMGSTLARDGKEVWAPSGGALLRAIARFGGSIKDLQLPTGIGDDHPGDGVTAVRLMPDLHALPGIWTPVKGYDRLAKAMTAIGFREGVNLLPFPYDWRLSNRYNARLLARRAGELLDRRRETHPDAQVVLVAHSMGGLIARWFVEHEGGAEITRRIVTLGTPYRGAAMAVDQLVNGVRRGIGALALDLTAFARSMPSLHQLLPVYACVDTGGDLARLTDTALPHLDPDLVADAADFHGEQAGTTLARDRTHLLVGSRQPTATTVCRTGDGIELLDTYLDSDDFGDGTVPAAGGTPHGLPLDTPLLHRIVDKHGNLQRNRAALDAVQEIVTASPRVPKADVAVPVRVAVPDLVLADEPIPVEVGIDGEERAALRISTMAEDGHEIDARAPRVRAGRAATSIGPLPPGAYTITVGSAGGELATVTSTVLVWPI